MDANVFMILFGLASNVEVQHEFCSFPGSIKAEVQHHPCLFTTTSAFIFQRVETKSRPASCHKGEGLGGGICF